MINRGNEIFISDYIICLHKAIKFFSQDFSITEVEKAVYFFFIDLQMQECYEELYVIIGSVHSNNPYLNFMHKPDFKILNPKAMAKFSYYILKKICDKFI